MRHTIPTFLGVLPRIRQPTNHSYGKQNQKQYHCQASQAVNIYYCVYRVPVDDTKEKGSSFALLELIMGRIMIAPNILPMELEHSDEKGRGSEMKQHINDVIPTLQLFSYMTLIVLAKLLRAYSVPGRLVYNPTQLILTNPIR